MNGRVAGRVGNGNRKVPTAGFYLGGGSIVRIQSPPRGGGGVKSGVCKETR